MSASLRKIISTSLYAGLFTLGLISTANAVIAPLESRLGGQAYYDPNLNITWLANANAGAGSSFDDGVNTTDGRMTWTSANAWTASLNIGGITGWRLPMQMLMEITP
ncbi:MAG TPA: hypothetical protein PKD35_00935 [Nitrosomonas sp.]|nr:hypothetical protein [Nitrosomonas sp.]